MQALRPRTPALRLKLSKSTITCAQARCGERHHTSDPDSGSKQAIEGHKKIHGAGKTKVTKKKFKVRSAFGFARKKRVEPSQSSARSDDTAKMGATTYNFVSR